MDYIPPDILQKQIGQIVLKVMQDYDKTSGFTSRKLTDTPTDALSVVNRKYVTLNGNTASRPTSSVIGQSYLDTTLGKPIWYSASGWIDATGIPV